MKCEKGFVDDPSSIGVLSDTQLWVFSGWVALESERAYRGGAGYACP